MTTFHLFPYLPAELRIRVWELAADPRLLQVDVYSYDYNPGTKYRVKSLTSPTPVPAILHASHESRQASLYTRAFTLSGRSDRYVWVNFELDMIQINEYLLDDECLGAEAGSFRRLRVEVGEAEMFALNRQWVLRRFPALEAVHVLSAEPLSRWCGLMEEVDWASPLENVRVIEKSTGIVMDSEELAEQLDLHTNRLRW